MLSALLVLALVSAGPKLVCVVRWDGPEHLDDECTGMVVGADGGAYLAGFSLGWETDFQFTIVKVGVADTVAWAHRYGAPLGSEDRAWAIALDSSGAVIATGGSIADQWSSWDFLTVKYTGSGDTVWMRRLGGAGTRSQCRGRDWVMSPSSTEDGIGSCPRRAREEKPTGIAVGPGDRLYVTGRSRNRSGSAGIRSWDVLTVCYTPGGDTAWTRGFDGGSRGDDRGDGVVVDRDGNCYVAGRTTAGIAGTDVLLLCYDALGRLRWRRTVAGRPRGSDFASGVLVDRAGRPLVFGALHRRVTGFDYLVACFQPDGRPAWKHVLDGAGSVDIALAACLDARGNLVVTGQSTGRGGVHAGTSFDVLTVRYSDQGETLWTRRFDGPQNDADRGWCIAAGPDGKVVVGATSVGDSGYPDLVLVCYSDTGAELWRYRYAGEGETRPVALNWTGSRLLVAGYTRTRETGCDYLLLWFEPGD